MQELSQPPKGKIMDLINTDLKDSDSKNPVQMFLLGYNPIPGQYVEKLCAPNAVFWIYEEVPEHTEIEIPEALMAYADPALPAPPRTVKLTERENHRTERSIALPGITFSEDNWPGAAQQYARENNIKICGCLR